VVDAVALDDGAEGVFEELEADVGEVAGDVGECEVVWADELDGGAAEHGVVLFADEAGVFDGFLDDVVDVLVCVGVWVCVKRILGKRGGEMTYGFGADDADVVFVCLLIVQGDVWRKISRMRRGGMVGLALADKESDADARHVEAIEPRLHVETDVLSVA
jgi:hypothetical protein